MKILVADDDPVYRRLLEATLAGWGYEVHLAEDGAAALAALTSPDAPTLAVLDWMMPKLDGVQVCRELRGRSFSKYTYHLLLTAKTRKWDLVEALREGADDFMFKPFDPSELEARLFAGRRILELQDRHLADREVLRLQATRDHLTSLWNHRAVMEILEQEFDRATCDHGCLAVVMADLDHFKQINDTHGHLAGDAVLRAVGERLTARLRSHDAVGRYGGEEFLIVLPGRDADDVRKFAARLKDRIRSEPVSIGDRAVGVTASLGAAVYDGRGATDVPSLLKAADAALYRAKREGRDRLCFAVFDPAAPS
ncbi:MAG: GGDEF domain-containing response regulator [Planctomycetia bacterium]